MRNPDVTALVKQAVDIVDVVGQVVRLRRAGNRHVGLCPFHQEKTPSFQVDSENQLYYCFGCGSGGDVLSFIMKYQNLAFGDALRYLADRYHIALPEWDGGGGDSSLAEQARREREEIYKVLQVAGDYFHRMLKHKDVGQVARDYIRRRSLPREVVETERLGYALPAWDGLANHLARSGIDPELGLKAGLLARSTKDNERFYDRFRNRLIFPIRDERGRIVAFGGRILSTSNPDEPKYLNSPETPVYHKGRMLYQLARAREACRQVRQVLLVEGYMDLLAFHSHGFFRVVATLGTALTSYQVRLLSRMANEVVLAYDADDAGQRAMLRALPLFLQEELAVSCLQFPNGMDPDDYLRSEGIAGVESLLKERKDLGMLAIGKALEGWDGSTAGKTRILSDLQPVFEAIRQPVVRADYTRMVAERLSLSDETVLSQMRHDRQQGAKPFAPHRKTSFPPLGEAQSIEENILRILINYPDLLEEVKKSGAVEYFQEPSMKAILEVLLQVGMREGGEVDHSPAFDLLPDETSRELYTRLRLDPCDIKDPTTQMMDWLQALPMRKAKQEARHLKEALRRAVEEGDTGRVNAILLRIQEISAVKKRKDSADHV